MLQKQRRAYAAALICGAADADKDHLSKEDLVHILPIAHGKSEEIDHIWNELVSVADGVMDGPCVLLPWSQELERIAKDRRLIRELTFKFLKGQS